MRQTFLRRAIWLAPVTVAVLIASVLVTVQVRNKGQGEASSQEERERQRNEPAREEHEKKEQREIDQRLHADASGTVRADLYRKSLSDWENIRISASRTVGTAGKPKNSSGPVTAAAVGGGVTGVQWTQIGPAPLVIDAEQNYQGAGPDAGQVVDIAIDPRNSTDRVMYAAFNDGGIWKTADGGDSWIPTTDSMPSNSMGAVALDPANPSIVYAGTGNIFNNGFFKGVGIYRSVDAAATWSLVAGSTTLAAADGYNGVGINKIVLPAADTLLVATNRGLFRSTDAGATFTQISVGGTTGRFITDLDLDTQTPATKVYASVSGKGIFVSTDGGATFPPASDIFAATLATSYSFLSFAQSTTNSGNTLYVDAASTAPCTTPCVPPKNFGGMWKSTTGGVSWTNITAAANNLTQLDGCQCGYDQTIGVDPVDENKVFIGFQELWYSSDGGGSFSKISDGKIHWDHHALLFSPPLHRTAGDMTTRLWLGTDGGIHYTDDASNFTQRNGSIATNLFRALAIGHGAGNTFSVGGAQDTGTMRHKAGDTGTQWHESVDADGGPTAVDWQNANNAFGISNGQFIRTTNGGDSWIRPGSGDISCMPMSGAPAVDPTNGQHVYVPTNGGPPPPAACSQTLGTGIFRSVDGGASFPAIGFAGTPKAPNVIAMTPTDSNLAWIGQPNGQLGVSTNFQAVAPTAPTFVLKTVTGATGSPTGLAIDPNNTSHVVAVYAGFSNTNLPTLSKHVFETTNGGNSWADIGGTAGDPTQMVPDMPLYSVVIDSQTSPVSIIVSTDLGVLRTQNSGSTWQRLGLGLPNVNAASLQIDDTVIPSLLRVATYGRSAFELTSATGPLLAINGSMAFGSVDVGSTATRTVQLFNVGSTDLHVNGFSLSGGSAEFSIISGPATPVTILPGSHIDFTVQFAPASAGDKTATFQISSDDPFQPSLTLAASGTGVAGKLALSGSLDFGTVPRGTNATRDVIVQNVGGGTLRLSSVAIASDALFSIVSGPLSFPVNIPSGAQVTYTVRFAPPSNATAGTHTATFTVASNDPPNKTLAATANVGVPTFTLSSTALSYGGIPVDNRTTPFTKQLSTDLTNQSSCALCDLKVTGLTITGANASDFTLVGPPTLPATVAAGNLLKLTVEFNPSGGGARAADLAITTDDPANPVLHVTLTGTGLKPVITPNPTPLIFDPTVFDPNCGISCGQTLPEAIRNTGDAELILDLLSVTAGSPPFTAAAPSSPPTRVSVGGAVDEAVTFRPSAIARKVTGTLHIEDQLPLDPGNNVSTDVPLCGEAVGRGIRVLVVDASGNPVSTVTSLKLSATGVSAPPNVNLRTLPLISIDPPISCRPIKYQYENQALSTTDQTAPRGSYYTLSVQVGNKKATLTFGLKVNEFKVLVVTVG